jgi:hypothetical protein
MAIGEILLISGWITGRTTVTRTEKEVGVLSWSDLQKESARHRRRGGRSTAVNKGVAGERHAVELTILRPDGRPARKTLYKAKKLAPDLGERLIRAAGDAVTVEE